MRRAADFSDGNNKGDYADGKKPDDAFDGEKPDAQTQNCANKNPSETSQEKVHARRINRFAKVSSFPI